METSESLIMSVSLKLGQHNWHLMLHFFGHILSSLSLLADMLR